MGTVIRRAVAAPAAVRRAGTAGPGLAARAAPALAGLALGVLALGPGLRRGFLLSSDMVLVPRQPFTPAMAGLAGGPPSLLFGSALPGGDTCPGLVEARFDLLVCFVPGLLEGALHIRCPLLQGVYLVSYVHCIPPSIRAILCRSTEWFFIFQPTAAVAG